MYFPIADWSGAQLEASERQPAATVSRRPGGDTGHPLRMLICGELDDPAW